MRRWEDGFVKSRSSRKPAVQKRATSLPSSRPARPVSLKELTRYTDPGPDDVEEFLKDIYGSRPGKPSNRNGR